jgi:hypothetical protein
VRDLFWVAVAVASAPPWVGWAGGALIVVAVAVPVWLWWAER